MTAVLVAELRKLWTTRLWWILLVCAAVLAGGYALIPAAIALLQPTGGANPFQDPATLRSVYHGGNGLARILALVVGVLAMGAEYRHRTLGDTYLATPRRLQVIGAKALAVLAMGLVYGLASVVAGIAAAIPFVVVQDGSYFLGRSDTWRSLALGVVSIGLWALIGFGVGLLFRNMIVAMLVGIGFAYLVEPSLTALFFLKSWDTALNLMPSGATNAMLGITSPVLLASPDPWPWWKGLLVLAGWCLLPAVLGVVLTVRKDVT